MRYTLPRDITISPIIVLEQDGKKIYLPVQDIKDMANKIIRLEKKAENNKQISEMVIDYANFKKNNKLKK